MPLPLAGLPARALPLTFRPEDKDPVWRLSAFFLLLSESVP
jgi:hypothetical protein